MIILGSGCTTNNAQEQQGHNEHHDGSQETSSLSREISGLPAAAPSTETVLINNEVYQMNIVPVKKTINGSTIRMYGYNGQIPGPTLRVMQGDMIRINLTNSIDIPATIHWHGIRVNYKSDGTPTLSQKPIQRGESYIYELTFPDQGLYWYHPHLRSDILQELGLYGAILVNTHNETINTSENEHILILDDIDMKGNDVDTIESTSNHALMGRFGNLMLVNGEIDPTITIQNGPARIYFLNAANTRSWKISLDTIPMKVIASDLGFYEKELMANNVILAPGERMLVEINPTNATTFELIHTTPKQERRLATIQIINQTKSTMENWEAPLEHKEIAQELDKKVKAANAEPDLTLLIFPDLSNMDHELHYKLMSHEDKEKLDGIEWEDADHAMNAQTTNRNLRWVIRDKKTGKENEQVQYKVKQGDIKKIRITNSNESMHPMQHPMHLHGQRFFIDTIDGVKNTNRVWKDTVLVPRGSVMDIIVEFSNPGPWMLHCHIAEHLEAGMGMIIEVENE